MSLRTPLGTVRGLGSAKEGVDHWWAQRLTAVALVPLCLWFVIGLIGVAGGGYEQAIAWIGHPVTAILLILLIVAVFHHAHLGMQVIYEDYIHTGWLKMVAVVGTKFLALILAVASIFAVLKIAFGG